MAHEGVTVGARVWFPDNDPSTLQATGGFSIGKVVSVGDKEVVVEGRGKQINVPAAEAFPANPDSQNGVPDNTQLMHLFEPNILHNLRCRFEKDEIYTYTAHILIALNPFKKVSLYTDELLKSYRGKYIGTLPPHVYAIADRAYRSMITDGLCQSAIVSGESGAGKTETSKILMRYLLAVSGRSHEGEAGSGTTIESKILDTNPILEAFGNAKTLRNNNSSRFGKYMKITFDYLDRVEGASIVTYLLEKSRLVFQTKDERNYHILYQLFEGSTSDEKKDWSLGSIESFRYLNQSGCYRVDCISDKDDFAAVRRALQQVGMSKEEESDLFRSLAGILNLGNIDFDEGEKDDALIKNDAQFETTARLLKFPLVGFRASLTMRNVVSGRGSCYAVPLKPTEAVHTRDALAKALYGRIFLRVVDIINKSLSKSEASKKYIGILDIYGFEFFEVNSFEQLCINMANEKLQQHFIVNVFKQEQEIYRREAITFKQVSYKNNQDVLDVLELKPTGVFHVLDEECRLPKATDASFALKVHTTHEKSKVCLKPKVSRTSRLTESECFVVRHFAGDVTYMTENFLNKNNDALHNDLEVLMSNSDSPLIKALAEKEAPAAGGPGPRGGGKKKKLKSVSANFLQQLQVLRDDLDQTVPNYIRCVKSNTLQKPGIFHSDIVKKQLRESGMLDVVQLMHSGYPTRCPYADLHGRYGELMPPALQKMSEKDFCASLLEALEVGLDEYQLGLTRVFFRAGKLSFLEQLRGTTLPEEVAEKVRRWLIRKRFKKAFVFLKAGRRLVVRLRQMRAGVRFFKAALFMYVYCKTFYPAARRVKYNRAARVVLSVLRTWKDKRVYQRTRRAAIAAQKNARMVLERKRFKKYLKAKREDELQRQKMELEMKKKQAAEEKQRAQEEATRLRAQLEEAKRVQAAQREAELAAAEAERKRLEALRKEEAARAEEERRRLMKEREDAMAREAAERERRLIAKAEEDAQLLRDEIAQQQENIKSQTKEMETGMLAKVQEMIANEIEKAEARRRDDSEQLWQKVQDALNRRVTDEVITRRLSVLTPPPPSTFSGNAEPKPASAAAASGDMAGLGEAVADLLSQFREEMQQVKDDSAEHVRNVAKQAAEERNREVLEELSRLKQNFEKTTEELRTEISERLDSSGLPPLPAIVSTAPDAPTGPRKPRGSLRRASLVDEGVLNQVEEYAESMREETQRLQKETHQLQRMIDERLQLASDRSQAESAAVVAEMKVEINDLRTEILSLSSLSNLGEGMDGPSLALVSSQIRRDVEQAIKDHEASIKRSISDLEKRLSSSASAPGSPRVVGTATSYHSPVLDLRTHAHDADPAGASSGRASIRGSTKGGKHPGKIRRSITRMTSMRGPAFSFAGKKGQDTPMIEGTEPRRGAGERYHLKADSSEDIAEGVTRARLENAIREIREEMVGPGGEVRPWDMLAPETQRRVSGLIRGGLCNALAIALLHGFKSFRLFGSSHVWSFIEHVASLLQTERDDPFIDAFVKTVDYLNHIPTASKDPDHKFRTLVCAALNEHNLNDWWDLVTKNRRATTKFYQPMALVCTENLRDELSHALAKLQGLHFSLDLEWESEMDNLDIIWPIIG